MISPRAVALRGLRFAARFVALRGLVEFILPVTSTRRKRQIFVLRGREDATVSRERDELWVKL